MKIKEILFGDGDYGFLDLSSLPAYNYQEKLIKDVEKYEWMTTEKSSSIAKNHCGAVAMTNIDLYYSDKTSCDINKFKEIHSYIGNGPVLSIFNGGKKYFKKHGKSIIKKSVSSVKEVKEAINKNHPVAILLSNALFEWHWVLVIGYRVYDNGDVYFRIITGWHDSIDKLYKTNVGSKWWTGGEYSVK